MPIDAKFIGKGYGPITYVVGQEKIKEYACAVGDLNPLYTNPEFAKKSKYGSVIAPPMFVVVFARDILFEHLFCDKDLNLNMQKLLHGEQEFTFHKIVKANDTIKTSGEIINIFSKNNNDFVLLETRSHNQTGELVVEGNWTFVILN